MINQSASFDVKRLGDDAVEVVFTGRLTTAEINGSLERAMVLLGEKPAKIYFIDATRVTAIEPSIRAPASDAVKRVQQAGVRELVVAVELTALRMLGAAIAFATGVPIKFFAKRDEALRYAREPRAQAPSARA